ncbi:uncharacterized protein LOC143207995 [Lasioglossum baleicum]|uniref:uncharacterized protein LOC143207995 n=1 Tax=Lasioglossum baleicum TaxID=434251 RepID=UPI003FCDA43B
MSRVPIRRLLIVLLVCLSETLAETGSPSRGLNNHSLSNEHKETGNHDKSDFLINELSTGSSASSQRDSDPAESSETIVYNRFANPPDDEENQSSEDEDPVGPPDHVIPYSEHELSKEVPTKPKYTGPGQWAKPTKPRDVSSEEVPSRLYAQVRRTHTVRRLPRKRAFANAESEEDRENAARLRKVVKNTKVNTVYTEEGYEDSAYDHAGHVRDADFDEAYARKVQDQLNSRKILGDGDASGKNSRKSEKYKRIDPEEFKEYDDDNRDNYETTTDHRRDDEETEWTKSAYPKLVAESGVQKLQEDLEKEVEEIERGVEISKLGSASDKQESVTSSPRKDGYRRKSQRNRDRSEKRQKPSSTEEFGEDLDEKVGEQSRDSQDSNVYVENYSTFRTPGDQEVILVEHGGQEATTIANNIEILTNGPSETYRYEVEANPSTESEVIDLQGAQNPTTVSYGQLFWDYFKAQQNQYTTQSPLIVESATVSSNVLLPSSAVENAFAPYSAYVELTTPFPIVDSAILNPQQLVSAQTLADPQYFEQQQLTALGAQNTNEQEVKWQPLNVQDPPKTETNDASHFILEPTSNLDSKEASFNKVFSNPVTLTNRKPRYKITMRHKAVKPVESSETVTPNSINEDKKENTTPGSMLSNPNYVKMLTHLRNEEGARKLNSSPPRNNLYYLKWMEDLGKMRPPVFQKESSYQNFIPHNSRGSMKPGSPLFRSSSAPLVRKTSSQPSSSLLPPAIAGHRDHKESDYAKPKRNRNVPMPWFRPVAIEAISRSRAKRRERRSPRWESDDETGGSTAAAKQSANNNAAANRGEIERAAKNSLAAAERNPRRKVTRGVEVGLVPDTIGLTADRPIDKKSRSSENDRGGGSSRGSVVGGDSLGDGESDSFAGLMENGEKDGNVPSELEASKDGEKVRIGGGSVKWNASDDGKKLGVSAGRREVEEGSDRITGTVGHDKKLLDNGGVKEKFKQAVELQRSSHERDYDSNLENVDGGKNTNNVKIDKVVSERKVEEGIDGSSRKNEREENSEKFLGDQKETKETIINEELSRPKRSHREDDSEIHSDSNKTDEAEDLRQQESKSLDLDKAKEKEIEEDSVQQKEDQSNMKSHEDLLQESPEITDDVINKEIEARFNDNEEHEENADENDEEKKIEVDVPEVPDFDYVEEITEEENTHNVTTTEFTVDKDKYPFYESEKLPNPSALRYATDPRQVPGKTYGRMNFYRSRDLYKHCDEVEPNLDVLPEEEKPIAEKGVNENPQRLKGLGDKLDCFKAKYFDDDPFDNPLFLEKEVEDPLPHLQMNPKKFASRIMLFPKEDDQTVVQKSSKRPENHKNQPRQRKPNSTSARGPRSRRVRIKSYSRPVAGSRPRVVRIKGSSVRYVKPRRPQKIIRRPISSASEVSSLYTPYQNQVYEDVMGTIKNMANSYQVEEITTVPTSEEAEVTEINAVKTNTSSNSTKAGKKEKDRKSSSSEEHSSSSEVKVGGKAPPRYINRHRLLYKRVRVPQKSKSRLKLVQVTPNGLRPINHRQRIIRYKRDTRDDDREFFDRSAELPSVRSGGGNKETASNEENVGRFEDKQERARSLERISDSIEKNETSDTFPKVPEVREKSRVPKAPSSDSDEKEKPPKITYTIKDRIRYSKPKGEISRVGKFTNKSEIVEDHRRKEPKYNYIKRRKPVSVPSTTELALIISTEPFLSTTTHRIAEDSSRELTKENKKVQYFLNNTQSEKLNSSIDESDQSSIELSTVATNKTGNGYAVHENLSEEQTTTQEPSAVSRVKSFLDFVSPSYTDFSSEEFKKSIFSNDTRGSNSPLNLTDSKESLEKENNTPKTVNHSYFSDEESSEKAESNANAEPSRESSEEGSTSKNNDSKEGRTFFSYWNRPSSPAESYEDEKYKDLGPRLNKPAFFHPPFSFLKSRKSFFGNGSGEDSEESEEKDEYVFPWHRDKKNEKKRRKRNRYYDKSTGDYEYPWERRERLTRKSKRLDDEEDHDVAHTSKYRRNTNPRGRIRFWTRREDSSEEDDSDNIESSSETRPVKKYSSRYNSKKARLPEAGHAQSKKVEEISRSIKQILEGDEKSSDEEAKVSKESKEKPENSGEKKAGIRGVSRGIVPEDVTLAPRRSGQKEESSILIDSAAKNRSSNGLLRNSLDNGESRLAVKKANQEVLNSKREVNSTLQQNKRRRRPVKSLSNVETTTKSAVNRGRRRQKMVTTPTISTTSLPRLARRKSSKLVDDLKDTNLKNKDKLSNDDLKTLDSPVQINMTMEHSANVSDEIDAERKSQIIKEKDEVKKSTGWEKKVKEVKDKLNESKDSENKTMRAQSSESEAVNKREDLGDRDGGGDEVGETKEIMTPINDDGKFDFMDERIEALSDYAKSDDVPGADDEFGFDSIVKSDGGVIPHNRATQLSQQESREIISTKSWISENYNF